MTITIQNLTERDITVIDENKKKVIFKKTITPKVKSLSQQRIDVVTASDPDGHKLSNIYLVKEYDIKFEQSTIHPLINDYVKDLRYLKQYMEEHDFLITEDVTNVEILNRIQELRMFIDKLTKRLSNFQSNIYFIVDFDVFNNFRKLSLDLNFLYPSGFDGVNYHNLKFYN